MRMTIDIKKMTIVSCSFLFEQKSCSVFFSKCAKETIKTGNTGHKVHTSTDTDPPNTK